MSNEHTWAIILAGGEGRRLHSLTTTRSGVVIPKQYCSLCGGPSLLQESLYRARRITVLDRICPVLANRQRFWWQPTFDALPANNVLVEPIARGTALGILLAILHIAARDPQAKIVVLPADHYVQDEAMLAEVLRAALAHIRDYPQHVLLLGMEPDEPDAGLGYAVPRDNGDGHARRIARFVEKPSLGEARKLIAAGAMWNAFIVVAGALALIELFERRFPEIVHEMQGVLRHRRHAQDAVVMTDLYHRMPYLDFSRDVLDHPLAEQLRLFPTPHCGWSDLGTPKRVLDILTRLPEHKRDQAWQPESKALLSLARQCRRLSNRSA